MTNPSIEGASSASFATRWASPDKITSETSFVNDLGADS
jgi:acyl carrier protein